MEQFNNLLHEIVIIITGSAGTGKIKNLCQKTGLKPTATTWAAASLTSGETYYRADRLNQNFSHTYKEPIPKSHKTCIIDEASMLSQEKLNWLLKTYPNRKWILIGDWNQLPPIDGTAIDISQYSIIELTKQFRFDDEGLGRLIQAIKDGNSLAASKIIENCIIPKGVDDDFYTNAVHIQHTNKIRDRNSHRSFKKGALLIACKKLFKFDFDVYYDKDTTIIDESGDKITSDVVRFPKRPFWFHNEILTVVKLTDSGLRVQRNNGTIKTVIQEDFPFLLDGRSLTCHKVQGQTIEDADIIIEDDFIGSAFQKQRLLFVACSRATKLSQLHFRRMPNMNGWIPFPDYESIESAADDPSLFDFLVEYCQEKYYENEHNFVVPKLEFPDTLYNINNVSFLAQQNINKQLCKTSLGSDSNKIKYLWGAPIIPVTKRFDRYKREGVPFNLSKTGSEYSEKGNYITKNPLKKGKVHHTIENIDQYINFAYEWDDISLEKQEEIIGKPYIWRIVHSGGKSLHVWMTLNLPIHLLFKQAGISSWNNPYIQEKAWRFINEGIRELFKIKPCSSSTSPVQLFRRPNAVRDNGNVQKLIFEQKKAIKLPSSWILTFENYLKAEKESKERAKQKQEYFKNNPKSYNQKAPPIPADFNSKEGARRIYWSIDHGMTNEDIIMDFGLRKSDGSPRDKKSMERFIQKLRERKNKQIAR